VVLDLALEVVLDFIIQLLVHLTSPDDRSNPERERVEPMFEAHGTLLIGRITRD
jgi:hypothetical protein